MTAAEFAEIAALVLTRTGVVLPDSKRDLVEARLWDVRRLYGLPPMSELMRRVATGDSKLAAEIIDVVLTHETLFFRDGRPFQELGDEILPRLLKARGPAEPLRIWSAACASGQEAYSLAIVMAEHRLQIGPRSVEVIASDVSVSMIERAKAATYSTFEVQRGLSSLRLITHFERNGVDWRLKPSVAGTVRFEQRNLLERPADLPMFDVIFCRNLMLYFDDVSRRKLVANLSSRLRDDGFLVVGASESLLGLNDAFSPVRTGMASLWRGDVAALRRSA